ncbi:hypothetical protein RZS08_67110, partial [Arthrospira platensis SPKY1]|nr:hypothetical protein [Arthrospira platensis SPKY1]
AVEPIFSQISEMLRSINQTLKDTKYMARLESKPMGWYKGKWRYLNDLEDFDIDFFSQPNRSSNMDRIHQFIGQGHLEEALDALYEASQNEDVVLLKAHLKKLDREV